MVRGKRRLTLPSRGTSKSYRSWPPLMSNVRPHKDHIRSASTMKSETTPLQASLIAAVLTLSGCASTAVKEYRAPDGTSIKTVKCVSDSSKCFMNASQSCAPSGTYRVLSSESHAGGALADWIPGPFTWYSMTYSCGPSDGRMPDFVFGGPQYIPPPPPPAPVIIKQKPTTTTCSTIGNTVTCNTY